MMTHRYFWRAAPAILALFAVSAGAQTCPSSSALYPSGLDGDAQLAVASNGVATYLNAALTAGATTFGEAAKRCATALRPIVATISGGRAVRKRNE